MTVWAIQDNRFGMNQQLADAQLDTLSELCKKLQDVEYIG